MRTSVLVASLFLTAASGSQSSSPCGIRSEVDRRMKEQFGEVVIGAGITAGGILYITANPVTGTFTIIMRRGDNEACVVVSGTGWASAGATVLGKPL